MPKVQVPDTGVIEMTASGDKTSEHGAPVVTVQPTTIMSLSGRINWQPPNPNGGISKFVERCRIAKEQPYLDERLMDDAVTDCAWENFRRPRLGRFDKQGPLSFTKRLGYGLDGIVWKVNIGGHVYALKVVSLPSVAFSTVATS